MKTRMVVSGLVIVMSVYSLAHAFDCDQGLGPGNKVSRRELLSQLPAEKEILFHQTMRGVREKGSKIRTQIKELRAELKEIITAARFKEDLFREKEKALETLHSEMHAIMVESVVSLAKRFTADEREILVELISPATNLRRDTLN
jgi:hypothetical protein